MPASKNRGFESNFIIVTRSSARTNSVSSGTTSVEKARCLLMGRAALRTGGVVDNIEVAKVGDVKPSEYSTESVLKLTLITADMKIRKLPHTMNVF